MKHLLFLLIVFFISINVFAQKIEIKNIPPYGVESVSSNAKRSEIKQVKCQGLLKPEESDNIWMNQFANFGIEHGMPNQEKFEKHKKEINKKARERDKKVSDIDLPPKRGASAPTVLHKFNANSTYQGSPPDNTMAISKDGIIITAINSNIAYYTENNQKMFEKTFASFVNNSQLTGSLYDPVLLYDDDEDKFIFVVLHGSTPSTSRVLLYFSKTNNPQDGWYHYMLNGNFTSDNLWFDYPSIAISNNELFITGNLFDASNKFKKSIILQVDKLSGFKGSTLNYMTWIDIKDAKGEKAFSLVPVSSGHKNNYGPGIYLVSNDRRPSAFYSGWNYVNLFDITNDMSNNPEMKSYSINTNKYWNHPDGSQKGTDNVLNSGDPRVQSAFYLDSIVHFCFTAASIHNANSEIIYNRLNISTLKNESKAYSTSGNYLSFASIASFATDPSQRDVIMGYLETGPKIFPRMCAIQIDNSMNFSNPVVIQEGKTYIDRFKSSTERWGDYTTLVRRHGSATLEVWFAGQYGSNVYKNGHYNYHSYRTSISKLGGSNADIKDEKIEEDKILNLFPNPAIDIINIEVFLKKSQHLEIKIVDLNGKLIKLLYRDKAKKGKSLLSFNRNALSSGTYFVTISNDKKILNSKKIIVR